MKKRLKGFSLVESLIGIAIFGVAIISATAVTIDSLKQIKDNEISDFGNSVMLQTLEYAKSNKVAITTLRGDDSSFRSFTIVGELENISSISQEIGISTKINSCSTSSPYYIEIDWPTTIEPVLCNQLIIEDTAGNNFKITSRIVYSLENETRVSEILGYRPIR